MSESVIVKALIIEDNTGFKAEIPIILTAEGELSLVNDFILKLHSEGRSLSTIKNTIQVARLFLDYLSSNTILFNEPQRLFESFVRRLFTGTIGELGTDPSRLYWTPSSTKQSKDLVNAFIKLTDWIFIKTGKSYNPLLSTTAYEQNIIFAAWYRKNQHDFLGHIKDESINFAVRNTKLIRGRQKTAKFDDYALSFPQKYFNDFITNGIGGGKDYRKNLRDWLVILLLHGGGLRVSEALTLWITDVFEDPNSKDSCIVRVYDEIDGKAPYNWKDRNGQSNRQAYLKEKYNLIPRIRQIGTNHLGFKTRTYDNRDNYIQVHWYPPEIGNTFKSLWKEYIKVRALIDCYHPYAFISFHSKHFSTAYTINAFNHNYRTALNRIGLEQNKSLGLSPHGHRHYYGRLLNLSGLNQYIIKKCLHHSSVESQAVYTENRQEDITSQLNKAVGILESKSNINLNFNTIMNE